MTRYILISLLLTPSMTWQERTNLPEPRAGYIAGVHQGKLMIAGGSYWQNDRKIYSDRADVFDATENRWDPLPKLPAPRSDAACTTIGDAVYAFGGVVDGRLTSSVIRLNSNGWSQITELPAPSMYGVAATIDDQVLLFGGLTVFGDLSSASRTLLRWQPGETWKKQAEFPGLPRVSAAVAIANKKLYVFGGAHLEKPGTEVKNLDDVWSYDPSTDQWTREATLPVARRAWSAIAVNDRILLFGGYTANFSSEIYAFDPKKREVTRIEGLPHPVADAKYVKIGNRIFTAGGESGIKIRAPWTMEGTVR